MPKHTSEKSSKKHENGKKGSKIAETYEKKSKKALVA
jgi:hypothetical protein